jgi:hypothetical protein
MRGSAGAPGATKLDEGSVRIRYSNALLTMLAENDWPCRMPGQLGGDAARSGSEPRIGADAGEPSIDTHHGHATVTRKAKIATAKRLPTIRSSLFMASAPSADRPA